MVKTPLRFVLLCDSLDLPAWQANCVQEAIGHGVAQIVGIIVKIPTAKPSSKFNWRQRWARRHLTLWRLFNRLYVDRFSRAVISRNIKADLTDVPILMDQPVPVGRYAEALSSGALEFLNKAQPDFILRFGFGILAGDVLDASRYGVWSFHHGDPREFRGQPPGFWEIMRGAPTAGVILQVIGRDLDAGGILHSGHFQVTPQSYVKTRDTLYFGAASWVRRTCAHIIENGWRAPQPLWPESYGPVFKQPENRAMLTFLGITLRRFFQVQATYKLHRQSWNCAVVAAPIQEVAGLEGAEKQRSALSNAHWMPLERGTFQADPFGYELSERKGIRILFELYRWLSDRGEIASIEYKGGQFGKQSIILDARTHLSYPYIIGRDGELSFVPEHSEAGDVSAFRLDSHGEVNKKTTIFPKSKQLDSTIIEWENKYYMFALDDGVSKNTDLNIYFADGLSGPWFQHPLNPVKSDVRSARPGGTPFSYEGRLYRPSQDCSTHYGSAVTVNEIRLLNEREFDEQPVSQVRPLAGGNYEYGLHTLSAVGDVTLIDGARNERMYWFRS